MKQAQETLNLRTQGQGLYEFTGEAEVFVANADVKSGLLTIFVRHTSASLTIQENADPDVQRDLTEFFQRLVPENQSWMRHTMEGPDDMPAHIKGALTDVSISVPVSGGKLALGTWQGLYLFEHRTGRHSREVVLHLIGE